MTQTYDPMTKTEFLQFLTVLLNARGDDLDCHGEMSRDVELDEQGLTWLCKTGIHKGWLPDAYEDRICGRVLRFTHDCPEYWDKAYWDLRNQIQELENRGLYWHDIQTI